MFHPSDIPTSITSTTDGEPTFSISPTINPIPIKRPILNSNAFWATEMSLATAFSKSTVEILEEILSALDGSMAAWIAARPLQIGYVAALKTALYVLEVSVPNVSLQVTHTNPFEAESAPFPSTFSPPKLTKRHLSVPSEYFTSIFYPAQNIHEVSHQLLDSSNLNFQKVQGHESNDPSQISSILLDSSSARVKATPVDFDLCELVVNVSDLAYTLGDPQGILIKIDCPYPELCVKGYFVEIRRVLLLLTGICISNTQPYGQFLMKISIQKNDPTKKKLKHDIQIRFQVTDVIDPLIFEEYLSMYHFMDFQFNPSPDSAMLEIIWSVQAQRSECPAHLKEYLMFYHSLRGKQIGSVSSMLGEESDTYINLLNTFGMKIQYYENFKAAEDCSRLPELNFAQCSLQDFIPFYTNMRRTFNASNRILGLLVVLMEKEATECVRWMGNNTKGHQSNIVVHLLNQPISTPKLLHALYLLCQEIKYQRNATALEKDESLRLAWKKKMQESSPALESISNPRFILPQGFRRFQTISGLNYYDTLGRILPTTHPPRPYKAFSSPSLFDKRIPPVRVLIVEDNPVNVRILTTFLDRRHILHEVAYDGQTALELHFMAPFDIILLDLQLPQVDGLTVAKRIRQWEQEQIALLNSPLASFATVFNLRHDSRQSYHKRTWTEHLDDSRIPCSRETQATPPPRLPTVIVALTADNSSSTRSAAMQAGVNDFVPKPVNLRWLETKIIEWGSIQTLVSFCSQTIPHPSDRSLSLIASTHPILSKEAP